MRYRSMIEAIAVVAALSTTLSGAQAFVTRSIPTGGDSGTGSSSAGFPASRRSIRPSPGDSDRRRR